MKYAVREQPRAQHPLQRYRGLLKFFTSVDASQRIGLLSQDKPHQGTHRRNKYIINVTEKDVCLANGLHFRYFDNSLDSFTGDLITTHDIATACTYKLPPQSSSLQQFMFRPSDACDGPSPNMVIASQHLCPDEMSLGEYKALCSMPLGRHIQWENILRQLAAPTVIFNKVETCMFILQIIRQAGPSMPGLVLREGHMILSDDLFTAALLRAIKKAAMVIRTNWQSAEELNTLIFLTQKVLTGSPSVKIQDICLAQLEELRHISFNWVMTVGEKASATDNTQHRNALVARAAYLALICAGTFDSGIGSLGRMLQNDSDASIFIQCSMIIYDRKVVPDTASSLLLPALYYRWQNLAFRGHRILANRIIQGNATSLDQAIQQTWAAYRPGAPWSAAPGGGKCCLNAQMLGESGASSGLLVYVNLLTGQLLINGRPLARLPAEFEQHDSYQSLFGHSVIEVMPSDIPGLDFSGRRLHMGYTIHMGKQPIPEHGGFDLCVRASGDNRVWEFVPPRLLVDAFPTAFVKEYIHWYDVDGEYIEFRPRDDPWKSSPSHWHLQQTQGASGWYLSRNGVSLINMKSETAKSLSQIFRPIEEPSKLHVMFHWNTQMVEIDIPRLRLGFDLPSGNSSIQSRQYRGMSVDPDQSVGTLVGLRNMLVLLEMKTGVRRVLIPGGPITWEKDGGHVAVRVGWQATTSTHAYLVNGQIGCLTDNGSLQSKIMLCYLHAITSFCIPDPLTKKTGTEQSLSIIRSASMRSFNRLQSEDIVMLQKLASLSPGREYYPTNERVMQSVRWDPVLRCLAQHHEFYSQVAAMRDQHQRMKMFAPDSLQDEFRLPSVNMDLVKRDRIRSSTFQISGFGAEDHTVKDDYFYKDLGRDYQSKACFRVFTLCKTLYEGIPSTQVMVRDSLASQLWKFLSWSSKVYGVSIPIDPVQIGYDATWFVEASEYISSHWCSIHRLLCSENIGPNKYAVMIWLSALAFSGEIDMPILQVLAAVYVVRDMASITLPSHTCCQPQEGCEVKVDEMRSKIHSTLRSWTPESELSPNPGETYSKFHRRVARLRKEKSKTALNRFISDLHGQWPTRYPSTPMRTGQPDFQDYFDTQGSMETARSAFLIWFDNRELRQYLIRVSSVFTAQQVHHVIVPSCPNSFSWRPPRTKPVLVSVDDIFDESLGPAPVLEVEPPRLPDLLGSRSDYPGKALRLLDLLSTLDSQAKSEFEKQYVEQLRMSVKSLQGMEHVDRLLVNDSELKAIISHHLQHCQKHHEEISRSIMSRMMISESAVCEARPVSHMKRRMLRMFASLNIWPRVSSHLLLDQLTRSRWGLLPERWRECLIAYGCSITALQRAKRLINLVGHRVDLVRELQNPGHTNWAPSDFPESLLVEIENEVLIRDVQENIARQMRTRPPGQNAVMQLNMGEGKSSVIVPIVAAAVADGSCLVRIIVAKPQSRQMFQMLVSKLGGLVGRRIYHLPVSRSVQIGVIEAKEIERICQDCMAEGGVLLVQPEHILSLRLMCLECFILGREEVGTCLLRTLNLFRTGSRDLVDESDENFSVKFELIYTMGTQRPLELSPRRWILTQQLLDLVRKYAPVVKTQLPRSIEVDERCPGSFPRTRLLCTDAAQQLCRRIADHICEHGIDTLPVSRQSRATRRAVHCYCLQPDPSKLEVATIEMAHAVGFWTDSTRDHLLLLRGLLAGNILAFCLGQKRWRVNYGPDNHRHPPTRLSVPYRAKDNPAPRSEFSHPEVVIVLTCLSYYYNGLSDDDLFSAFSHLVGSDQADTEYQLWVDDAPGLPPAYHQLGGVNLQDWLHCVKCIFPSLRLAKGVIDYFLAHIIFPKGLREFPSKLSASGWDIAEIKGHSTVGFSGTNDSRVTLPLNVEQLDLPAQVHTNALVLEHLLRPENSVASIPTRDNLSKSDAQVILDMVVGLGRTTRVILDAGAQILELKNLDVARTWLEMTHDEQTKAVVFVNEYDEITVVDRAGLVEPLQTSPFEKHLDSCLVFLDEAHTRGIDLRLPENYQAAVTLGPNITKDKLVQACMRMRKLGKGQSVVLCIPEEIKYKILSLFVQRPTSVDVSSVLCWAVSETWADMQRSIPLWAVQGKRFEHQTEVWRQADCDGQLSMSSVQAEAFLEPESQSIEQRYRPSYKGNSIPSSECDENDNIRRIRDRCLQYKSVNISSAQLEEEQERELAPEIEQEREVQRPAPAQAEQHSIHPDIRSFVATGELDVSSTAVNPAFMVLKNTSAAGCLDVSEFPLGLLVTMDFANTVRLAKTLSAMDSYQRPVEWVLTSNGRFSPGRNSIKHMVVISPYEANELHSDVSRSRAVTMHVYAPRQHLTCCPLDKLDLYSISRGENSVPRYIPESLRIQLNLFAGQLYISSRKEYREICDFLGLASVAAPKDLLVAVDGFILSGNQQTAPKFTKSPVAFLKVLMSQIRKDGQEIDKTHLGKILDGKPLSASDFQDHNDT